MFLLPQASYLFICNSHRMEIFSISQINFVTNGSTLFIYNKVELYSTLELSYNDNSFFVSAYLCIWFLLFSKCTYYPYFCIHSNALSIVSCICRHGCDGDWEWEWKRRSRSMIAPSLPPSPLLPLSIACCSCYMQVKSTSWAYRHHIDSSPPFSPPPPCQHRA